MLIFNVYRNILKIQRDFDVRKFPKDVSANFENLLSYVVSFCASFKGFWR